MPGQGAAEHGPARVRRRSPTLLVSYTRPPRPPVPRARAPLVVLQVAPPLYGPPSSIRADSPLPSTRPSRSPPPHSPTTSRPHPHAPSRPHPPPATDLTVVRGGGGCRLGSSWPGGFPSGPGEWGCAGAEVGGTGVGGFRGWWGDGRAAGRLAGRRRSAGRRVAWPRIRRFRRAAERMPRVRRNGVTQGGPGDIRLLPAGDPLRCRRNTTAVPRVCS